MRFFEKSGWLLLSLTLSLSVSCSKTDVKSGQEERSAKESTPNLAGHCDPPCEVWVIENLLDCGFDAEFVYPCGVPDQTVTIYGDSLNVISPQCLSSDCGPVCPDGLILPNSDTIQQKTQDAIWCYQYDVPPCPDGSDPCNGEGWKICWDQSVEEFVFLCFNETNFRCIDCNN